MRLCNVSTGRVLQLITMAIGYAARARVQPKMWEFGMSCVFADIQAKSGMVGNYDIAMHGTYGR